MDKTTAIIKEYYDSNPEAEWARLDECRLEFDINTHFLDGYIRPGDKLLDLGGGPGRYALHFAAKGCDVTLCDLSGGNVEFALSKAAELGLPLRAMRGDAREIDSLTGETYDHILLMGPMYHILDEAGRKLAMRATLSRLRSGGTLAVAFINLYAGLVYEMRERPEAIFLSENQDIFVPTLLRDEPYAGPAFTEAYFTRPRDILPFMERFPLEKLRLLSSESMLAPCSDRIYGCSEDVYQEWLRIGVALAEREESFGLTEHLLYIGRKI